MIAIGQAGGRFEITPERVGINIDDARIPDNDGQQPIDKKIQGMVRQHTFLIYQ